MARLNLNLRRPGSPVAEKTPLVLEPAERLERPAARDGRPRAALLSVIVPTRNEAANVGPLVQRLDSALAGVDYELVFVDDSEDATPRLLEELAASAGVRIAVRHRPPEQRADGLAGAIIEGLGLASGDFVAVIDADLQHPPEILPQMLTRAFGRRADIVVASRYVPGGSAAGLGTFSRRLISQATRWFARLLFHERLWSVQDPGSGFFICRRELLSGIELRPIGYKILMELLMRTSWSVLEEVPYTFEGRAGGVSKASLKQGMLFLRHALRIFRELPTAGRVWKFLMVGASGALVNLSVLWLLGVQFGLPGFIAWIGGLEMSLLSNCLLNRTFTWSDRRRSGLGGFAADVMRYHVAVAAGILISTAGFTTFSLLGAPLLVAGLGGIALGAFANYLGCDNLVFRRRRTATVLPATSDPERAL